MDLGLPEQYQDIARGHRLNKRTSMRLKQNETKQDNHDKRMEIIRAIRFWGDSMYSICIRILQRENNFPRIWLVAGKLIRVRIKFELIRY